MKTNTYVPIAVALLLSVVTIACTKQQPSVPSPTVPSPTPKVNNYVDYTYTNSDECAKNSVNANYPVSTAGICTGSLPNVIRVTCLTAGDGTFIKVVRCGPW